MMVSGQMIRKMGMENIFIKNQMIFIKVIGKIIWEMDKVYVSGGINFNVKIKIIIIILYYILCI